jgi:hypothetical protein
MRKILVISVVIVVLFSCSREDNYQIRELNISYTSAKAAGEYETGVGVTAYPNPFNDVVDLHIGNSASAEILISDDKGDFKKFTSSNSNIMLNFTDEKSGVYYCEVLSNNTVYRTYLIKN